MGDIYQNLRNKR